MDVIRILPEKVASQIAAGEIIERPASVVRELIDNSIDAAAKKIVIRIEQGGKRLIKISDNGAGMNRDDLLLSIERHATSKIRAVSDLFSVKTLGFRGEALPSMSSVSRMEITSRPVDQLIGYRLKIAGGKLKSIDETGAPAGTIVELRDLFFNMPARRKFLKTVKTETDHIIDTLSRIALPFLHLHFRLDDAGRTVLNFPSSENELDRFSVLFGRNVATSMIEASQETGELRVRAYLAPSDLSRARGDRIFIYINNRNIRDRLVTRAVMEGYGQRLMKGRYPQVVLFLEFDPSLVDINVHPTKQEVHFNESHLVYKTVISTIERALGKRLHSVFDAGYLRQERSKGGQIDGAFMAEAEPKWEYSGPVQKETDPQEEFILKERVQIIGQLKETYILCQVRDGLLMVDQHAAHERIVYETLKKSYNSLPIECQSFLIPHKLEFSLKDGRVIMKRLDHLARFGLEIEHFGGSTFLLRSVPSLLVNVQWDDFLLELIPVLEDGGDLTNDRVLDRLLTIMACHGAIRASKRLSQEEMSRLLDQLEEMDLPTNCPHGRPIFQKFNYYEIEKMFKRVV